MKARLVLVATLASIGALAAMQPQAGFRLIAPARAECVPGTHIDKSTVEQIRDRLIKAGFKNPLHLRKGCDNVWHGTTMKDGQQINVAVTTDGHIVQEGD